MAKKKKDNFMFVGTLIVIFIIGFVSITSFTIAGVKTGDNVTVSFVGTFENGTKFDSGTLDFVVGGGMLIPGFDEAVVGMKAEETKMVTVPPEKGYGQPRADLLATVNRTVEGERRLVIGYDQLELVLPNGTDISEVSINSTINTSIYEWPMLVVDKDDTFGDVMLQHEPVLGSLYYNPFTMWWPVTVIELTDTIIKVQHEPKIGSATVSPDGRSGKVTHIDDDIIVVDFNHRLAGKTLVFEITLDKINS